VIKIILCIIQTLCQQHTLLLFEGHTAGSRYSHTGGGSNYLCLPEDPQWKNYIDGDQSSGAIYGVEYQLDGSNSAMFSTTNNGGTSLYNYPVPCAVCYVGGRSTILMIPARTQCSDDWTTEYGGYLASAHISHQRTSYICLDEAPEIAVGDTAKNQGRLYPVDVRCGSLPCSVYVDNRELACVVCSK